MLTRKATPAARQSPAGSSKASAASLLGAAGAVRSEGGKGVSTQALPTEPRWPAVLGLSERALREGSEGGQCTPAISRPSDAQACPGCRVFFLGAGVQLFPVPGPFNAPLFDPSGSVHRAVLSPRRSRSKSFVNTPACVNPVQFERVQIINRRLRLA